MNFAGMKTGAVKELAEQCYCAPNFTTGLTNAHDCCQVGAMLFKCGATVNAPRDVSYQCGPVTSRRGQSVKPDISDP
jgi:hypothetical protein